MRKIFLVFFLAVLFALPTAWAASSEMALKVTDPGTGAEWPIDAVSTVKWAFRGDPGQTVAIRLVRVGWVNAQMIIAESAPVGANRAGSFKWKIPADLPPGADYTVSVMAENGISDTSGGFKLTAGKTPVVKIELEAIPKGGERWSTGSKATIRWSYAGNPGQAVKLALIKKDDATVTVIVPSTPIGADGKGSFEWTVPALKPSGDYYVGIVSLANPFYQDTGKGPVVIGATK